jgi:hypothetical protein
MFSFCTPIVLFIVVDLLISFQNSALITLTIVPDQKNLQKICFLDLFCTFMHYHLHGKTGGLHELLLSGSCN